MIDSNRIFNIVTNLNAKLGVLGASVDVTGTATIIPSSVTFDVIIIASKGVLVPIEIRKDKDNLGWLYDPKDRYVIVENLGACKLKDLSKRVEEGVKENKKSFSSTPEEFKLMKYGESILTFININTLSKILC